MAFKVDNKVTVYEKTYRGQIALSTTKVVAISARVLKTEDGKRWHPSSGWILDAKGHALRSFRIQGHCDGDEEKIHREQLRLKAEPLFQRHLEDTMHLICTEDLQLLAEIGERLLLAKAQAGTDPGEDS